MKLNKVSYKRVEEQLGRGFDILTNGELPTSVTQTLNESNFMKKNQSAWERLSPRAANQPNETNKGFAETANNSNFELTSTNF